MEYGSTGPEIMCVGPPLLGVAKKRQSLTRYIRAESALRDLRKFLSAHLCSASLHLAVCEGDADVVPSLIVVLRSSKSSCSLLAWRVFLCDAKEPLLDLIRSSLLPSRLPSCQPCTVSSLAPTDSEGIHSRNLLYEIYLKICAAHTAAPDDISGGTPGHIVTVVLSPVPLIQIISLSCAAIPRGLGCPLKRYLRDFPSRSSSNKKGTRQCDATSSNDPLMTWGNGSASERVRSELSRVGAHLKRLRPPLCDREAQTVEAWDLDALIDPPVAACDSSSGCRIICCSVCSEAPPLADMQETDYAATGGRKDLRGPNEDQLGGSASSGDYCQTETEADGDGVSDDVAASSCCSSSYDNVDGSLVDRRKEGSPEDDGTPCRKAVHWDDSCKSGPESLQDTVSGCSPNTNERTSSFESVQSSIASGRALPPLDKLWTGRTSRDSEADGRRSPFGSVKTKLQHKIKILRPRVSYDSSPSLPTVSKAEGSARLRPLWASEEPRRFFESLEGKKPFLGRPSLPSPDLALFPTDAFLAPKTVAPRSPSNPNLPFGFGDAVALQDSSRCSDSLKRRACPAGEGRPGQSSFVDSDWLTWKLGVLHKTVEDMKDHLEKAEKTVQSWGSSLPQDPSLAEQYAHNVRILKETLPDLQRGIDDVNDQAARIATHSVLISPANAAQLQDLNVRWKKLEGSVNDHWRSVAPRSQEVAPFTLNQLASSVMPPWERAAAINKVPYYINHAEETTHWDHPEMMALLDSLTELNHIKFSAYRTASKLRALQKKLALDKSSLQTVTDVFDEHGLRGQNDKLIDVNDMVVVLSTLYSRIGADHPDVNTIKALDVCLNWLLNVYDSQRTGQMRVLSFRVGLVCLCSGHLEEKYRYMFRLIADPNRLVDQRKLGLLLHDCVQVPRQLGEVAAFGGSNIEPSVRSCFVKAGKDRDTVEAVHFLTWVQQEPQSLVWLAVLHRLAASENIQHQVKCNICKTYPIVGLRYRCLKCLSFDLCQMCFFEGRSSKNHKITHPMHEYCTATTTGDEMKDFTKALKNKFKSKRSLQKHSKKGYLPVQTVLEGDTHESPTPSPQHISSQDMHNRLEIYASRLAEVELRANSNSTLDSEDEHGLIAQYCQSLSSTDAPFPVPRSPLHIMASVDADQKDELEQMIRDLEEENRVLLAEYDTLKAQQPHNMSLEDNMELQRSEVEMLAEAKLLREHKERLEARMGILEEHNHQLEAQLQRLRQLLDEGTCSPNKSGTLQTKSVTASQLAMDSPAKVNGHSNQGDLEKAFGNLVATMDQGQENGLPETTTS